MPARIRQPASGPARSFLTSTALHAVVLGLGCALGLHVSVGLADRPTREDPTTSIARVSEPVFEEPEEPLTEAVAEPDLPPDPELPPEEEDLEVVYEEPELVEFREPEVTARDFRRQLLPSRPKPKPEPKPEPVVPPPAPVAPAAEPIPPPTQKLLARLGPKLIEGADPKYPRLSLRAGEQGSVLCLLHLDAQGRVLRVEVEESSGHSRLDRAAVDQLKTWRFAPGTLGGKPVESTYRHRVRFELG